jgi:hypothetical protein
MSSPQKTFQLLGFEIFQVRLQKKKHTSTVSIEVPTQRRNFRPLKDKLVYCTHVGLFKISLIAQ